MMYIIFGFFAVVLVSAIIFVPSVLIYREISSDEYQAKKQISRQQKELTKKTKRIGKDSPYKVSSWTARYVLANVVPDAVNRDWERLSRKLGENPSQDIEDFNISQWFSMQDVRRILNEKEDKKIKSSEIDVEEFSQIHMAYIDGMAEKVEKHYHLDGVHENNSDYAQNKLKSLSSKRRAQIDMRKDYTDKWNEQFEEE